MRTRLPLLLLSLLATACIEHQARCRLDTVPVQWASGAQSDWTVQVCNVQRPLTVLFVNDLKRPVAQTMRSSSLLAPARDGCGPFQCRLALNGVDACFEEGDVYPTPCCEVYCTCWEADGLDCGWEF